MFAMVALFVFTTAVSAEPAVTTVSLNLPDNVTYGDSFTFSGSVTSTSTVNVGQVAIQQNRSSDSDCDSTAFGEDSTIGTDTTIVSGAYSVGPLPPAIFAWPAKGNITSFTPGNYYVKSGLSVGDYGFQAAYSGGGSAFKANTSGCKVMTVVKADTTATGSAPASITIGDSFDVDWTVGSTNGVTGNTATGNVTISEQSSPASSSFGCTPASRAVSAAQTTGTGFSQSGSGGSASTGFTCTPDTVGTYTFKIHFADTDGNYNNDDSDLLTVVVSAPCDYSNVTVSDNLTVPSGTDVCYEDSTISGNVTLQGPSTNLDLGNTVVSGNIDVGSNSSLTLRDGSLMTGNIECADSSSTVYLYGASTVVTGTIDEDCTVVTGDGYSG
jgi:hypothetical protein